MKFYLIVAKGKKQGTPIPIDVDLFLMGSGKMCQLRAEHETIADQHCALVTRERKVFIQDLNSGEATIVNGEVIPSGEEWPLHAGHIIQIGPLKFMIQFHDKVMSQRELETWAKKCVEDKKPAKVVVPKPTLEEIDSAEAKKRAALAATAEGILSQLSAKKGVVKGRLRIAIEGNITIVRIHDAYMVEEAEVAHIKKELQDNLSEPKIRVLLDMKNVKRMSSAGAMMLGEMQSWLRGLGSTLAMCRLRPDMLSLLKSFPTTKSVPFFEEKEDALSARW